MSGKRGLSKNYSNQIERLSPYLVRFKRVHDWRNQQFQIDVFSKHWSFAVINGQTSPVGVERLGERIEIRKLVGIYIPPFSVIKWLILQPKIEWCGYFSTTSQPDDFRFEEPIAFNLEREFAPQTSQEIFEEVKKADPIQFIGVVAKSDLNFLMKKRLDKNYQSNFGLKELANEFDHPKEVLIRKFTRAWGLSPLQYRQRLRLMEAVPSLMLNQLPIHDIAHQVGFNDVSFFNKVFKRELNATPSAFQF